MLFEIPVIVGAALLATAAIHDAAFRTVPNTVCAALAGCGLLVRALDGNLPGAIIAALIVFSLATVCWSLRWMGGGDVKLVTAASLLVAPMQVPAMLVAVALAGGILTLPYLVARHRLPAPAGVKPSGIVARALRAERRRLRQGGPLPYAVAIAAGVAMIVFQGAPS